MNYDRYAVRYRTGDVNLTNFCYLFVRMLNHNMITFLSNETFTRNALIKLLYVLQMINAAYFKMSSMCYTR